MRHIKHLASLLLVLILCTICGVTALADDDNATGGSGNTSGAANGYGWYNSTEYLWKVSLYVGKSDTASKSSNLMNNYYLVGGTSIYIKNTNWSVSSSTKFGAYNKVQYYNGTRLAYYTSSPKIISDSGCPKVPIACGGNIDTVKSYFGDTNTVNMVLNALAQAKGTSQEGLVSGLTFTIDGTTKTWDPSYILPRVSGGKLKNGVPWVIIYEPVVVAHLKDNKTLLGFTATEFALAESYGWYNFGGSGSNAQLISKLTNKHLPTSVQLEYSWFGYPVYNVTDDSHAWADSDIIKGGGWGMRYLDAQEYMDFSVSDLAIDKSTIYQGDYLTATFRTDNWDARNAYSNVPVELLYNNQVIKTQYVNFSAYGVNYHTVTFPAGTNLGANNVTVRINWANRGQEINPANNSVSKTVTIRKYYDLSVSDLQVKDAEYENRVVTVKCLTDNWDQYNAYNSVPVQLVYGGQVLATQYVDYPAYARKYVEFNLNTGTVLGNQTVEVRINWANRNSEVSASNNSTSKTIQVKEDIDLSIDAMTPNADYREGTSVITSFNVNNLSTHHITPSRNLFVTFQAYYYDNGIQKSITTQTKSGVVIPSKDSNLVYFKWTVPTGLAGKTVYCYARVNSPQTIDESNYANNEVTKAWTMAANTQSVTPNPEFNLDKPSGWFDVTSPPPSRASTTGFGWYEWSYQNNSFVRKYYSAGINALGSGFVSPDVTDKSAVRTSSGWTVKSGYGLNIALTPSVFNNGPSGAVTGVQRVEAYFPEFNYSMDTNQYRTLELVGNSFMLKTNPDSTDNGRIHFIPVWKADGPYYVQLQMSDMWTPAGMVRYLVTDSSLKIQGSMYDDYYTNRK